MWDQDQTLDDDIRYVSWPLATPQEQARRVPYSLHPEACKAWLPLPVWSDGAGFSADAPECYFSDLYKQKRRDPCRHDAMAPYTAAVFCPGGPVDAMIPATRASASGQSKSEADLAASRASLRGQIDRGQRFVGTARS